MGQNENVLIPSEGCTKWMNQTKSALVFTQNKITTGNVIVCFYATNKKCETVFDLCEAFCS